MNLRKVLHPGMIRPLIEKAIALGWKYDEPGNAISLADGALVKDTRTVKWGSDMEDTSN